MSKANAKMPSTAAPMLILFAAARLAAASCIPSSSRKIVFAAVVS